MRRIVVVGAGVVGISLAHALTDNGNIEVTVLERDEHEPRGSTTYAPGYVGLYNDVPLLTELAQESAAIYDAAGTGFRRSGGLELSTTERGAAELQRRVDDSRRAGIDAELRSPTEIPDSVASFVDTRQLVSAAFYPDDGSAETLALTTTLRNTAVAQGARFQYGQEVTSIDGGDSRAVVRTATGDRFEADAVVLAAGVWGPRLAGLTNLDLPLFPVAHPYVYDAPTAPRRSGPFVRWPEHHVYSRIHGDRLGIGTYDHPPIGVEQSELRSGACLTWPEIFSPAIASAQQLLLPEARFDAEHRVNGVFAMTPDNLPFLGPHPSMPHVWIAQALWVTHAAGAAHRLADTLLNGADLPHELRIDRFAGTDKSKLQDSALRLYRDIYATDTGEPRAQS